MRIALLIDVDNYKVTENELAYLINRLNMKGEVVYGKVYNYSDRINKELNDIIENNGFDVAMLSTTSKKTKKSIFDLRIAVDAVKLCCKNNYIDAFCLACGDGEIIPLISMLRAEGKIVMGCFNEGNEANEHVCNEVILLNRVWSQSKKIVSKSVVNKTSKRNLTKKVEHRVERSQTTNREEVKPVKLVEPARVVESTSRRETLVAPQSPERWERVERRLDEVEKERPAWMDEDFEEPLTQKTEVTKRTETLKHVEPKTVEETDYETDEEENNSMPQHRFNAQNLAAKLESFARRTAALNFDSGEDIEEKKQLLAEIDECLNDEEFQGENLTADEEEAFNEIKSLVESLKETIKSSIE